MATAQQLALRKKLLNRAIKPGTGVDLQKKNKYRLNTLKTLEQPGAVKPGEAKTLGGRASSSQVLNTTTKPIESTQAVAPTVSQDALNWYARSKGIDAATYSKAVQSNPSLAASISQGYSDYQAANQDPVATYGEIGEANIQADYDANVAAELGLTGESSGYTSLEEYLKDQYASLAENTDLQKEQLDLQKAQTGEQASAARNTLEGNVEAASGLMGNREGVISGSNVSAYDRLKEASSVQISRLQRDQDMSFKAIEQAKTDLARAEREGNTQLASQYRQQLLAAESAAQTTETAYVNALTLASEEERNVQAQKNANLTTFTGMVDQGVDLSVESISNFANQLGVDFDTAYGYYAGAQAIRDDKALSLEEKEIANAQNLQNLNDQITGKDTQAAKAITYLQTLRDQGAPEEVISYWKEINGITDYQDPLTAADLEYKNLENKIKQNQLDGIPTSIAEYETLFDLKQKMDAAAGTGGAAYVSQSIDGISMEYEGGQLNVTLPRNADGTLKAYQCGEFVNRAWGLAKGGTDGFGSTAESKRDLVSRNGFFTKDKSFMELLDMVKPGMAFASYAGSTDHTGLIVSAPDINGNYMTLEANVGDGNPNVSDPPIYKTRNVKDQDVYGFVSPPDGKYQVVGGSNVDAATMEAQALSLLQGYGGTADERATLVGQMTTLVNSGEAADLSEAKKILGFKTDSDKTFIDTATDELKDPKKVFTEVSSKLDSLPALLDSETGIGDVAAIVNFLKTIDPNSVARESEVASVQNAVSLGGQVEQIANRLASGKKLTDDQRAQLTDAVAIIKASTAAKLYEDALSYQQEFKNRGLEFTLATDTFLANLKSQLTPAQISEIESLYSGGGQSAELDPDALVDGTVDPETYSVGNKYGLE